MINLSDLKKTKNQVTFNKTYDVCSLDSFETVKLMSDIKHNNGTVSADCIVVDYQDISSKGRPFQTRVRDTVDAKIIKLTAQIKKDGLLRVPTVRYNSKTKVFDLLGGHHRLSVWYELNKPTEKDPDTPCMAPVCVVDFKNDEDLHNFLADDNNHPESCNHNAEDAKKFLQDKEEMGAFRNLSDSQKEAKQQAYLEHHFGYTQRKAKNFVKKLGTKKISSFIKPKASDMKQAQRKAWGYASSSKHTATPEADGCNYLQGNTQMYQNTVGNFRKHFWRARENCPGQTFKLRLATHVQITDSTTSETIKANRRAVLEDLANENKNMYIPLGVGLIDGVILMEQIKNGTDADAVYKWDNVSEQFVFDRNL